MTPGPMPSEPPKTTASPNAPRVAAYWTIATTVALFLYHLCYQYIYYGWLVSVLKGQPPGTTPPTVLLISVAESLTTGLIIGSAQWIVLRLNVRRTQGWIVATMTAWVIWSCVLFGYDVLAERFVFVIERMSALGYSGQLLLFAAIEGLILGIAQWFILRRWGSSTRNWILIAIGAQVASVIVSHMQVYAPVATLLGWITEALVTGAGMANLLKQNWPSIITQRLAASDDSKRIDLVEPV